MDSRPLLVSGPLIAPIQKGTKTETRRLTGLVKINQNPDRYDFTEMRFYGQTGEHYAAFFDKEKGKELEIFCPFGGPGTTLWVRENWAAGKGYDDVAPKLIPGKIAQIWYQADGKKPAWAGRGRPSIHLPRWLSRMELNNEGTYPERIQDITEDAAKREGMKVSPLTLATQSTPYRYQFFKTFNNLNGSSLVNTPNPWVWVVKFTLKTPSNGKDY